MRFWGLYLINGIFIGLFGWASYTLFFPKQGDEYKLKQFMASHQQQSHHHTAGTFAEKKGIFRDVWRTNEGVRMQTRLESSASEVFLAEDQKMLEALDQPQILMQKELYFLLPDGEKGRLIHGNRVQVLSGESKGREMPINADFIPMQDIYYIQAKEAIHDINENRLTANNVTIYTYEFSGHQLPDKDKVMAHYPLMKQTMQHLDVFLTDSEPVYEATGVETFVYPSQQ